MKRLLMMMTVVLSGCSGSNLQRPSLPSLLNKGPLLQGDICPSLTTRGENNLFQIKQFFVINLTALPKAGTLVADSDMDGISDNEEPALGFDPVNRRTKGILDSACLLAGGGNCTPPPTCSTSSLSPGLIGCDLTFFTPVNNIGAMTGLDSDNDGIPDLLELIRHSKIVDGDVFADSDRDGLKDISEITQGSDPANITPMSDNGFIKFNLESTSTVCNKRQTALRLESTQVPLIPGTLPYTDTNPFVAGTKTFDLSHGAGENVIAVFYISQPVLAPSVKEEIYAKIVKVNAEGNADFGTFTYSDFNLIGKIDP